MRWKFYFWILIFLIGSAYLLEIAYSLEILLPDEEDSAFREPWTLLDWFDTIFFGVSMIGLYGLAYQKTIGKQRFWERWFVFILIFDISYIANDYYSGVFDAEEILYPIFAFSLIIALFLPYYIALYLYGYKSEELWNPQPTSPE